MNMPMTKTGTNYDHSAGIRPRLPRHSLGMAYGVSADGNTYLRDVLARISDHPAKRLAELLPTQWKAAHV